MEHQVEVRQMFDESFKRMVIEEYLATKSNKMELLRKYNIHFKSANSNVDEKTRIRGYSSHSKD